MDGKSQRELKEKKRRHDQRAWFWIPFAVTLSLLVLLAGLVTVEVRCRQMGLGDYTPPLALSTVTGNRTLLHYDLLGWEGDLDLTFVDNLVEYVEEKLQGVEQGIASLFFERPGTRGNRPKNRLSYGNFEGKTPRNARDYDRFLKISKRGLGREGE